MGEITNRQKQPERIIRKRGELDKASCGHPAWSAVGADRTSQGKPKVHGVLLYSETTGEVQAQRTLWIGFESDLHISAKNSDGCRAIAGLCGPADCDQGGSMEWKSSS